MSGIDLGAGVWMRGLGMLRDGTLIARVVINLMREVEERLKKGFDKV